MLGSLPGDASLLAAQYYAHPRNQFWRLIGAAIGREDLPQLDYDARLAALKHARVGLWDVIASAQRRGSLDAQIRSAAPAPLVELAATLPRLRAIAFNGAAAARLGRRQLAGTGFTLVDLPSSSPANAAIPFEAKLARWRELKELLA